MMSVVAAVVVMAEMMVVVVAGAVVVVKVKLWQWWRGMIVVVAVVPVMVVAMILVVLMVLGADAGFIDSDSSLWFHHASAQCAVNLHRFTFLPQHLTLLCSFWGEVPWVLENVNCMNMISN